MGSIRAKLVIYNGPKTSMPILMRGELGYASDSNELFIGSGNRTNVKIDYNDLPIKETIKSLATKAELKTESARIDNLVAVNNPTQGNSELIDIRVDTKGTTHTSAGESIRNQIKEINTNIDTRFTTIKNDMDAEFNKFTHGINTDMTPAKVDYFGNEHINLGDRLNDDFDNLHQRINNSQYLPYEGSNITADKSYYGMTKDTIIKGRTLQNCIVTYEVGIDTIATNNVTVDSDNVFTLKMGTDINDSKIFIKNKNFMYKLNTEYTVIVEILENTTGERLGTSRILSPFLTTSPYNEKYFNNKTGISKMLIKTREKDVDDKGQIPQGAFYFGIWNTVPGDLTKYIKFKFWFLEGNHLNTPNSEIPFFKNIQNVGELVTDTLNPYYGKYKIEARSCGKNLFNPKENKFISGNINFIDGTLATQTKTSIIETPIKVKPNTKYTIKSFDENVIIHKIVSYLNSSSINNNTGKYFSFASVNAKEFVFNNTSGDSLYIIFAYIDNTGTPDFNTDVLPFCKGKILVEESQTSSVAFEPYRGDSKVYYLDEPLNGYKNELFDAIEESKLIRRMGKLVLDGGKNWIIDPDSNGSNKVNTICFRLLHYSFKTTKRFICDGYIYNDVYGNDVEGVMITGVLRIGIDKSKLSAPTVDAFVQYLNNNPINIYYELETPITIPLDCQTILPNGVSDTVIGNKVTRNIGKSILTGSLTEKWVHDTGKTGNTALFYITGWPSGNNCKAYTSILCDKFKKGTSVNNDEEAILIGEFNINIRIAKTKLETPDLAGFKKWLQQNNVTIWYELAQPFEELTAIPPLKLKTFDERTHMSSSNNFLPLISTSIPSNVQAVVSALRQDNTRLKNELDTTTASLNEVDSNLVASNWDIDYRLTMMEQSQAAPASYNNQTTKYNISKYDSAKIMIEKGKYNEDVFISQLSNYLSIGLLSQIQFDDLLFQINNK